jgi:hypothetical protein
MYIFTPVLANRQQILFQLITSSGWQGVFNWAYRILPKPSEIMGAATNYIQFGTISNWFPFWTTGIFIVVMMGLSIWMLHRKNL